jgi:hypothetical protein
MAMISTQQRKRAEQVDALSAAIRKMFEAQKELQGAFPKRLFTPDGRMIGDIGQAIAELTYQVTVDARSRKDWDGKREEVCAGCPEVQVRATQTDNTYVKEPPDDGRLLVFKIFRDGSWECCYNGDARSVWVSLEKRQANKAGEKTIKVDALRTLNKAVEDCERIGMRQAAAKEVASLSLAETVPLQSSMRVAGPRNCRV